MPSTVRLGLRASLALCLAGAWAVPAWAADWTVEPGASIAAAIARAKAGDTLRIKRGHYQENLLIDKPLTLRGVDRPTIDGGLKGDTIRITAADVILDGLIVTDSGDDRIKQNAGIYIQPGAHRAKVINCVLAYNLFGLWIEKANDVEVRGNNITGKRDYASTLRGNGIQLYNTTGARIIDNEISYTRDALYVDVSHHAVFRGNHLHHARYGTHYMNSYYNLWENNNSHHNRGGLALMEARHQTVRNNHAWANSDHGIMLRTLQNSVVENNVVAGNQRGFFIYNSQFNQVRNNLVIDNHVGVHLWAGSVDNSVENNDFIANRVQIRYVSNRDTPWGEKQGNYWSNYLGWDRNGDGIGDIPYEANDMVDRLSWRYPMMKLLLSSPSLQSLRLIARQFPLLRAPSVVDPKPHMRPSHNNWREWLGKYFN